MNVLVFTSLYPNAIEPELGSFIKKRMKAFSELEGCNIKVVAPVPYCPPIKALKNHYHFSLVPRKEVIEGITVYHPRYPLIPKISMVLHGLLIFLACIRLVQSIHRDFFFDVLDAHFVYPDGFAGALLGKMMGIPVVVSARGSDIHEFSAYPMIRPLIKAGLNRADHVISVCQALKKMMSGMGIPSEKISVISNGIDVDKFHRKDKCRARTGLGIDQRQTMVLSVGSLTSLKGHHYTINAVEQLKDKYPDICLYIIGKGPFKTELEGLVKQLNLADQVSLVGTVPNDELADWYNAADVFCLSSSREGWANVLTESLACGTPAVATKVFGSPEIVTHGQDGVLVERSVTDIAGGLCKVLGGDFDSKAIAQKRRKRTWESVAKDVKQVFELVLQAKKNPGAQG